MKKERIPHVITLISLGFIASIFIFSILSINNPAITGFTVYQSPSDGSTTNDTYLRESLPNNNYSTATTLRVGRIFPGGGTNYTSLIKFNVSSIDSGDTISTANVQVYVETAYNTDNITLKAYRVTKDWIEPETSWNKYTSSNTWVSAGGDYAEELDSVVFENQTTGYYNFSIVTAVRGWLNGTYNNYGIILISTDAETGNYTRISSSESATSAQRPQIIITHFSNAPPSVDAVSTDSSLTSPKQIGQTVNITVSWTDLESNSGQMFACNTTAINTTGCNATTFCNTSFESSSPSSCLYTTQSTDNRTTTFYVAVCDANNCTETSTTSYFYINHQPTALITQPNGGETANQSQGNYSVEFNVTDADSDNLTATIYYGTTQNSTTNTIISNINLTDYCTDADSDTSTTNTCTYSWNTTGLYGTFFLTINLNDSFSIANDSSDASFDIRSLTDNIAPNITSQWIVSDVYSGKPTQIYANVSDPNINTVWVSINTTPQTNLTMTNTSAITYNVTWTATSIGTYQFKVYANDTIGNTNTSMSWQQFTIRAPNATTQNQQAPSTALPYHTIKITGELNSTDSLIRINASLNIPGGFTFLSDYPQSTSMGNFTANQTKNTTWFISVPITEATYTLNITYTDQYSNSWQSSNFNIQVTSAVGGGYSIDVAGYPEVEATGTYYVESNFKQSGTHTSPDSMTIIIYDSAGNTKTNTAMTEKSTGIYNYSYAVGAAPMSGQWETIVNATKSGIYYYTNEFWKVVGALFDVRDITIINPDITGLNISVILENIGNNPTDIYVHWNLTRVDTSAVLDTGSETIGVGATPITHYIEPTTTYIGQVRITFIGIYLDTEKAGAYKTFTTTDSSNCGDGTCNGIETCSTCPTDCGACTTDTGGGGGGGGATVTPPTTEKTDLTIHPEKPLYLTKNIEKTITLTIENTGDKKLTNITLELEGLNKELYTITPLTINTLKPGKTKEFQITFLIKNFIGKYDFNYLVKTNEIEKREPATLIVLTMKDYFLKELERIRNRIQELKNEIKQDKKLEELSLCEKIADSLEENIEKEKFINAEDDIKKADDCLDQIKPKIKIQIPSKIMENLIPILLIILLIILILAILAIGYLIYKKFNIINYINKRQIPSTIPQAAEKPDKGLFGKRLEEIEKELEG